MSVCLSIMCILLITMPAYTYNLDNYCCTYCTWISSPMMLSYTISSHLVDAKGIFRRKSPRGDPGRPQFLIPAIAAPETGEFNGHPGWTPSTQCADSNRYLFCWLLIRKRRTSAIQLPRAKQRNAQRRPDRFPRN